MAMARTKGGLRISVEHGMHAVSVLDVAGRQVASFSGAGRMTHATGLLQTGVYVVKVEQDGRTTTASVLVH